MATLTQTQDTAQAATLTGDGARSQSRPQDRGVMGINEEQLARGLGWFSIGLGLTELLAPRAIGRLVGSRNHNTLVNRAYGLREIAAGVGILARFQAGWPWLWSRVAGDVMDLAALGAVLRDPQNDRGKTAFGHRFRGRGNRLDVLCAQRLGRDAARTRRRAMRAEANMIVNRPPEECYAFWRNFENLPRFMSYLESVRITGDRHSHWTANAGGTSIEWDAEIESESPNERISWRSLPGADLQNAGSVEFERAPAGRGTIVRVQMEYGNPLHALASAAAGIIGKDPEQMIRKDLRRFKQVMETGEVITTEGQPAGRSTGVTWLDRIAR